MRVRTPAGLEIRLRDGATVLEFARALHSDLVAHVRGARAGARYLGLLDPLAEDDVVYLNVDPHPRPLPARYREVIGDPDSVRSIERAFGMAYRRRLELLGRRALTRRLLSAGLGLGLNQELADESVDAAARREDALLDALVRPVLSRPATLAHFYTDLALLSVNDPDGIPVGRMLTEPLEWLLPRVYQQAVAAEYRLRGPEWAEVQVELCPVCFTEVGPAWIEEPRGDGAGERIVRCHRQGARCRGVWRKAGRAVLAAPPTPYFHVRARERRGITADIATAVAEADVSLQAFVARATGVSAVLRLEIDQASEATMRRVKAALEAVDGIQKVYAPRDGVPRSLEHELRDPRPRGQVPELSPYDVGGLIRNRRRLYGREPQIEELYTWLDEALRPDVPAGRAAWVAGPYKYGKSSLVETIFEMRRGRTGHGAVMVRTEGIGNETWFRYSHKLALGLLHAAGGAGRVEPVEWGLPEPDADGEAVAAPYPLLKLVAAIRRRLDLPVVIAVDEMLSLFTATRPDEAARMVSTFRGLLALPAVALILIGPDLRWAVHDDEALRLLREAREIPLATLERQQGYDLIQRTQSGRRVAMAAALMRSIYNETLGHPLWTQLIANGMWSRARDHGRLRRYSRAVFNEAVDRLLKNRLPFTQHVSLLSQDTPEAAAMRAFLARLAQRPPPFEFTLKDFRAEPGARGMAHGPCSTFVASMQAIGVAVPVEPHGRPYRPVNDVRPHPRAQRWQVPPVLMTYLKRNKLLSHDGPEASACEA